MGISTKSSNHEKMGVKIDPKWRLKAFRETLDSSDLRDMGFPFTWNNHREGKDLISERLDRYVANTNWMNLFPKSRVRHGVVAYLDHILIFLHTIGESPSYQRGPQPFKFEPMWLGAQKCYDIVEEC